VEHPEWNQYLERLNRVFQQHLQAHQPDSSPPSTLQKLEEMGLKAAALAAKNELIAEIQYMHKRMVEPYTDTELAPRPQS
jgi:hypothetical protein